MKFSFSQVSNFQKDEKRKESEKYADYIPHIRIAMSSNSIMKTRV